MKIIISSIVLLLLMITPCFARIDSRGEYIQPNFAITGYYDFFNSTYRSNVYGMFKHFGIYSSYAAYETKLMDNGYAGWLYSDGSVILRPQYEPFDAKNSYSYMFDNYYFSHFYQTGYNFGMVFRIGDHFNVMTGISSMKTTEFAWISYTYPTKNGYTMIDSPPADKYIINKAFYDVKVTGYEIGIMYTHNFYAGDVFLTYYPEIKKWRFSVGVGTSF